MQTLSRPGCPAGYVEMIDPRGGLEIGAMGAGAEQDRELVAMGQRAIEATAQLEQHVALVRDIVSGGHLRLPRGQAVYPGSVIEQKDRPAQHAFGIRISESRDHSGPGSRMRLDQRFGPGWMSIRVGLADEDQRCSRRP